MSVTTAFQAALRAHGGGDGGAGQVTLWTAEVAKAGRGRGEGVELKSANTEVVRRPSCIHARTVTTRAVVALLTD